MRCYLSFTNHEVFEGVIPPEETLTDLVEESQPPSETAMTVIAPKESPTKETPQELTKERKCPKFPGWEKLLHPSWLVVVAGASLPFKEPRADLSACGHLQPAYEDSAHQNPLSYTGIRGCLSMGTYSWFPRCDYLFEKPII